MSPISVRGSSVHSEMVVARLVRSPQRGCRSCGPGGTAARGLPGRRALADRGVQSEAAEPAEQAERRRCGGGGLGAAGHSLPYLLLKLLCSNSAPSPLV